METFESARSAIVDPARTDDDVVTVLIELLGKKQDLGPDSSIQSEPGKRFLDEIVSIRQLILDHRPAVFTMLLALMREKHKHSCGG